MKTELTMTLRGADRYMLMQQIGVFVWVENTITITKIMKHFALLFWAISRVSRIFRIN